MNKLVEKVNWNMPNQKPYQMYMYGEASVEANQEMQEPLEKLYEYENKLDVADQIRDILENLTEYVESHSDYITEKIMASDVIEYIDEMWNIFGVDTKSIRYKEEIKEYISELDEEIKSLENELLNIDSPNNLQLKGKLQILIREKNNSLRRLNEVI